MIGLALLVSMMGCSKQEAQPCDTAVYICDTAAYWGRVNDAKATIDATEGVWVDQAFMPGCNGAPNRWVYSAKTNGWTSGGNLANAWAPAALDGWNEEHPLRSVNASATGAWDELLTQVRDDTPQSSVEPGVNTAYSCGEHDASPGMVYAYRVYDLSGALADCAIFGTGPNAASNVAKVFAGNFPEENPVTRRNEITVENCSMWKPGETAPAETTATSSQ